MKKKYELIVIGGGAGGLTVAAGAASFGIKVALIDKSEQLGGDCLHYGCVPSKALIASAKEVYTAKTASYAFGMGTVGAPDFKEARRRIEEARSHIQAHDDAARFEELGVDVFTGEATFKNKRNIIVNGAFELKAERLVIATGSRPVVPEIPGIQEVPVLTNRTVYNLEQVPKRMVVAGGGPVGMEIAQALARFGTEVHIVDPHPHLFPNEEPEVAEKVQQQLQHELHLHLNQQVVAIRSQAEGYDFVLANKNNGKEKTIAADVFFSAVGRQPNTDTLELEKAGVAVNEDGSLAVKKTMQTSQKHIFAVGDVTGAYPFTHRAGLEAQTVVGNLAFGLKRQVKDEGMAWSYYTDPSLFHFGLTEEEALKTYDQDKIRIYRNNGERVDRMIAEQKTEAFVKVITDEKGYLLGAHACGENAGDWMQEMVQLHASKQPLRTLANAIYPYPARGEIVKQIADQYWRDVLFAGKSSRWMKRLSKILR
ncbi:dihydrolipoyl dehydrogenase family protein [Salsuginibacillus kocurii]|uniref:dihydrolipoyl dehydrogenase family protein n=1 Tax=Salsuginibacillus kocurii TaxID=427078 RepID=UPI00036A5B1B|nr:FAD-dependent oxidoreductase [Salsuginibacillus kocurii]